MGDQSITSVAESIDSTTPSDIQMLSPGIQSWIRSKGWPSLRPIQSQCVSPILNRKNDVLITAPTASGKTEAAFLPVISWLERNNRRGQGYGALCLSPLKALINDQAERISSMCKPADIDVIAWHGDASSETKKASWEIPGGVTIMTPESLEALFACRPAQLRKNFKTIGYIVIDEYHAFFDSERGVQLISLLSRVEHAIGRVIPRIAISATIGDPNQALEFLRPGQKTLPGLHCGAEGSPPPIRLKIKSFPPLPTPDVPAMLPVAQELFQRLRGSRNIIFAGSKRFVEELTHHLNRLTVAANTNKQFYPHHGSLSKDTRAETERVLKDDRNIVTAIATSTLEMGIDINNIESVAQVGAPSNVAAIKQRLGRSGRRASKEAILRILIPPKPSGGGLCEELNLDVVQAAAIILLLLEGWVEPVGKKKWHLSTLIQQILGIVASTQNPNAELIGKLLFDRGPWDHVNKAVITLILSSLEDRGLIAQYPNVIRLTEKGKKTASGFNFFTAFDIPKSYRLVVGKSTIGTLPATYPIKKDQLIIFGGSTWNVTQIDAIAPALHLEEAKGVIGKAPSFGGSASFIHENIRYKMFNILSGRISAKHCDPYAQKMIESASAVFIEHTLNERCYYYDQNAELMYWFIWSSSSVVQTIEYCLSAMGYQSAATDMLMIIKEVSRYPVQVIKDVRSFVEEGRFTESMDNNASKQALGKFDRFASIDLLKKAYLDTAFDIDGTRSYLHSIF